MGHNRTMPDPERERLILGLSKQVHSVAKLMCKRAPIRVRADLYHELVAAAWCGAIKAVDGFDEARGVKLSTYAECRIRGEILDYMRSQDLRSRHERKKMKQDPASAAPVPRLASLSKAVLTFRDWRTAEEVRGALAAIDCKKLMCAAELTRAQREVLREYKEGEGRTMGEIAARMKVSEGRISQIRHMAIAKMAKAAGAPC